MGERDIIIQDLCIEVTQNEIFLSGVSESSALPYPELKNLATERWHQVTSILRGSDLEELAIGPLAEATGLPWPSTRTDESLVSFLEAVSPYHLLRLRGLGKRKARTLLSIILGLGELAHDEGSESDGSQNRESQCKIDIPTDPIKRVEMFWSRISEKIGSSEFADEKFSSLARQWGILWPVRSRIEYTLGDVVRMDSLSQFMIRSRGLGKKKKPSIASIIWRAWAEVEPDGPAEAPKSGSEIARDQFEALDEDTELIEIIRRGLDLAGVNEREHSILDRRYGLTDGIPKTLEEIGRVDLVTRERIRQIQQLGEKRIMDNQTSREFLRLALERELSQIFHNLENFCGSPLLRIDGEWHRSLIPSHCFLVDVIHGNLRQLMDQLVTDDKIQRTSSGWWLGRRVSAESAIFAEWVRKRCIAENKPLSLAALKEGKGIEIEHLTDSIVSVGLRIEMGYVFHGRVMMPERRCLFALRVALETQRWLWPELEFFQAAMSMNADVVGSMRILMRDTECIPGIACNIPGPFVVINPVAAKNSGSVTQFSIEPTENDSENENQEPAESIWEQSQGVTIASQLEELMSHYRILKYETLENHFCEAGIAPPGSLGPTLLSKPQFVRYAPAYWGLCGLQLEDSDVEQLCNEEDLARYVRSKRLGGLAELFPFWNPEMEYRWCRWAEGHSNSDLFYSLLAVCEPATWLLPEAIRLQWEGKKIRFGINRLPSVQGNLDMGYVDFDEIYGLVHLASQRGSIGPATIPHFYGLQDADRKALGTMALLGALGVLDPRVDMDSPWVGGSRVNEWLQLMSELFYLDPTNIEVRWREILDNSIEALDPSESFGWFTGEELKESFCRWKA